MTRPNAACGYDPKTHARRLLVMLECPHCRRTKSALKDKTDPPGTARVVASCDECPDDAAVIDYFDTAGRQIDLDGNPMTRAR